MTVILYNNSGGTDAATHGCAEIRPGILDLDFQDFGYRLSSWSVNAMDSLFLLKLYASRDIGQKVPPKSSHSHAQSAHISPASWLSQRLLCVATGDVT